MYSEEEFRNDLDNRLISVIVPIYNTETYLPCCIDSILSQTYKNIEIILVDDGSTDGSLDVCNKYVKSDSRIVVVKGIHQGLVSARKLGVRQAKGLYCMFIDSDDWIDSGLIEAAIAQTAGFQVDIVNFNIYSVCGGRITSWAYSYADGIYEDTERDKIYQKMMFDFKNNRPGVIQSLCSKLIKRSILLKSLEQEDERITYGEDAAVVYIAMLKAKKIAIMSQCLYFYRIHSESMMNKMNVNIFRDVYIFQRYMQSIFSKYDAKYNLEKQLQAYIMLFLKPGLNECFSLNVQEVYEFPLKLSNEKTKVVLYGAGIIGKSYYMQFRQLYGRQIEIVAWVDKKMHNQIIHGYKIESPDIISKIDYDEIILAVKSQTMAEEIRKELADLNITKNVIWAEPVKKGSVIYNTVSCFD